MQSRYKDDTFHMLQAFNKNSRRSTGSGFGLNSEKKYEQIQGKIGNTWDAKHMTNFLSQSHYSNWSNHPGSTSISRSNTHKRSNSNSTHDHFFRTTTDNKNVSRFGYTNINTLISNSATKAHNRQVLQNYLNSQSPQRYANQKNKMIKDGKFQYEGNSVKFRVTDPLTFKYVQERNPSQFEKERLKWIIKRRYPHGITGVEHNESPTLLFYLDNGLQKIRVREEPNSHKSHLIDPTWKSKGRISPANKEQYGFQKSNITHIRKFRNDDIHGYNIITNRESETTVQ